MEKVALPRPFVEELLQYFLSLPMKDSEFAVMELRAGLFPDKFKSPHAPVIEEEVPPLKRPPIVERIVKDDEAPVPSE